MHKHSSSIKYSSLLLGLCECTEIEILNVNYILIHVQRYIRMRSVKTIIIDKCKQNIKIFIIKIILFLNLENYYFSKLSFCIYHKYILKIDMTVNSTLREELNTIFLNKKKLK